MDGATICVAGGTTTEGNVGTEFARRGLTANVQSFDERRPAPGGVHRRAVRRLVERQQPAQRPALGLPGRARRARRSSTTSSRKEPLTPAVVDGDSRWAQAVELGDLRHDPGRGVRAHDGQRRRRPHQRGPQRGHVPRRRQRRRHGARPGPRAVARLRLQHRRRRSATTARSSRPTWRRSGSSAGVNALWTDGGLQYAPPYR